MSEQKIQTKLIKYLETQGAYVVKVMSASRSGIPDILACYRGRFLGVEVKKPSTKLNTSKLQEYNLELIKDAAGFSCVAWDEEQVIDLLQLVDELEDGI